MNMRANRFRLKAGCISWNPAVGSNAISAYLESLLGPNCMAQNSSWSFGRDLTLDEINVAMELNKGSSPHRRRKRRRNSDTDSAVVATGSSNQQPGGESKNAEEIEDEDDDLEFSEEEEVEAESIASQPRQPTPLQPEDTGSKGEEGRSESPRPAPSALPPWHDPFEGDDPFAGIGLNPPPSPGPLPATFLEQELDPLRNTDLVSWPLDPPNRADEEEEEEETP